eukprot:GEMP01099278.1.p1 GENE.GEMP01099278.1~~GEMP01099278.1.p1  ORF type:complete len:139 (+),score=38.93 GEMP01099278.1:1-417(+)
MGGSVGSDEFEASTLSTEKLSKKLDKRGSLGSSIGKDFSLAEDELEASVCPKCWCLMPLMRDIPREEDNEGRSQLGSLLAGTGESYDNGVDCDGCGTENLEAIVSEDGRQAPYYHCGTCKYDLCKSCAMKEMIDVWWN